jgi:hypothetical protein
MHVLDHTNPILPSARPFVRLLTFDDIPALLDLEREKWAEHQAASADDMAARITAFPQLSIGAFDDGRHRALASAFLKPIAPERWRTAGDWYDYVTDVAPASSRSLFGISMSARGDGGVAAIMRVLWPHLRALGWQEVYLGSPIPGWLQWKERHPERQVDEYVARRRRDGLPADPQLRYYHGLGFTDIVAVKPRYFPHERSEDHGVILRRAVVAATPALRSRSSALSAVGAAPCGPFA